MRVACGAHGAGSRVGNGGNALDHTATPEAFSRGSDNTQAFASVAGPAYFTGRQGHTAQVARSRENSSIAEQRLGRNDRRTLVVESHGCELRSTMDAKGEGVFATREFRAGEIVIVGVIKRRVSANHSHATQVGPSEYVELSGLGPKANHSCDPNCGVRINGDGAPDLVALETIAVGEEVTFDYAMRNFSIQYFPARCGCGSHNCRTSVTGWKDLPEPWRRRYRGFVAPYLLEIERELTTCDDRSYA